MIESIISNIASAIILTVLFAVFLFAVNGLIFIANRRPLFEFFGIKPKYPMLRVYLSRLEINPGGTTALEPIQQGYYGPAVNIIEYWGALQISQLFHARYLIRIPSFLQRILEGVSVDFIDVHIPIDVSPNNISDISFDNLILIGSSIYNIATKHYLSLPESIYYFDKNTSNERVIKARYGGFRQAESIPGRSRGQDLGIIQRIKDPKKGTSVYICAGIGASATYGCTVYLAKNWQKLHEEFGAGNFAVCLAFPNQIDYNSSKVVRAERVDHYPDKLDI